MKMPVLAILAAAAAFAFAAPGASAMQRSVEAPVATAAAPIAKVHYRGRGYWRAPAYRHYRPRYHAPRHYGYAPRYRGYGYAPRRSYGYAPQRNYGYAPRRYYSHRSSRRHLPVYRHHVPAFGNESGLRGYNPYCGYGPGCFGFHSYGKGSGLRPFTPRNR